MTNDSSAPWVLQYRVSVSDTPTPALDQAILAAAGRHLASRRAARHIRGAFFIGTFALLAISTVWHGRMQGLDARPTTTNYGRSEGVIRRYLLEIETPQFAGFGIAEGNP